MAVLKKMLLLKFGAQRCKIDASCVLLLHELHSLHEWLLNELVRPVLSFVHEDDCLATCDTDDTGSLSFSQHSCLASELSLNCCQREARLLYTGR